jgi:hypothetical protein
MNHAGVLTNAARGNKKPLTLTDSRFAFDLGGPKTLNGGSHIANTVARYRSSEPVTFIAAKQELVLVASIPNHQHQMARGWLYIKNFGDKPIHTADIEELAAAVPANIDPHFLPLPRARSLKLDSGAHAREMPTQILHSRHTFLNLFVRWLVGRGLERRSHLAPRRIRGELSWMFRSNLTHDASFREE